MDKNYRVSCDPVCGFMVQSHDREEAVSLAYDHVTKKHPDKPSTRGEIDELVEEMTEEM